MKTLDFTDTGSIRAWMAYTQFLRIVSWDQVKCENVLWSPVKLSGSADRESGGWSEWRGVGGASRSSIARVREVKLVWKQDAQQVILTNWEEMELSLCVTAVYSAWSTNKRIFLDKRQRAVSGAFRFMFLCQKSVRIFAILDALGQHGSRWN